MNLVLKQWISLLLLSLMLIKVCVIPLLYLDFEIRKTYIIANLCENRNRPKLNCNGKCYLAKKIAESQKQEEKQAEKTYLSSLIYQVMNLEQDTPFLLAPNIWYTEPQSDFPYHSPFISIGFTEDIFHPPLYSIEHPIYFA
jgi:hypothetical protein